MSKMVNLKINDIPITVEEGKSILGAAWEAGIKIPSLCFLHGVNEIGACRICVVEVKGARSLVASCVYPVSEGMEVYTNTDKVRKSRRMTLELILSNHRMDCLTCPRNKHCELRELAAEFNIDAIRYGSGERQPELDTSAPHLVRDNSKCVLCRRCVSVCRNSQEVGVVTATERGFDTTIGCAFGRDLAESDCVSCGQCINACPTGALSERDDTAKVWEAIHDPSKHVVVGTAPAVRAALGEAFNMPGGTNVEGQMVTALRRLGFDKVFDVDYAADLTIMEEGTELLDRLNNGGALPLITSCSPGWIRYCEQHHPDLIPNLSSCKSPQQMLGSMVKTYYAEKVGIDPKDIVFVTVMPCVAKKYEVQREEQRLPNGCMPVDVSITTRELVRMINYDGILFENLPIGRFDRLLGISTGAAVIFGGSGGVMEAALRTVSEILVGEEAAPLEFTEVRSLEMEDNMREASYQLAGQTVNVAVASGLRSAKKLLDLIASGEKEYHFVEIMCCPGGCINGGGQPIHTNFERATEDIVENRHKALYSTDATMQLRKSNENPYVQTLYDEYLEHPGSHKAHELLHCTYVPQTKYRT